MKSLIERFEDKIFYSPDGCWYWTGAVRGGYGVFARPSDYKLIAAHRFSYELYNEINPNDLYVCHHCDNKLCVNPNHLFLGTHQDNTDDMYMKGKGPNRKGESNPCAKLTMDQVTEIRKSSLTFTELGKLYGVSRTNIHLIKHQMIWRTAT